MRVLLFLILAAGTVLWLLGWPSNPGPYSMSWNYVAGLAILFLTTFLLVHPSTNRAEIIHFIRRRKRIVLPVFAVFLSLLFMEGTLRFSHFAEWWGGQGPDQPGYRVRFDLNRWGNRGPEVTSEMMKNKLVLLGLGDSFLFGGGLEWEDTFLQQLEEKLKGKTPLPIITVNAALPGLNTREEANFLSRLGGALYHPKIVMVEFTLNDPETSLYRLQPITGLQVEPWTLWRSHLFFSLVRAYNTRMKPYREYLLSLYRDDYPGWFQCQLALREIRDVCRANRALPLLVIYPILEDFSNYPYAGSHQKVASFARTQGFEVIDLLETFRQSGEPLESLWLSRGDNHPNAKAHSIAAQRVAQWIQSNWDKIPVSQR